MTETTPIYPKLSLDEAKSVVAGKKYPRVSEDSIKAKIASVHHIHLDALDDPMKPGGTICVITMKNGWTSTGFSAPADPRNYDADVGERYAYDNAFKPLWQLEGYLLREKLYSEGK